MTIVYKTIRAIFVLLAAVFAVCCIIYGGFYMIYTHLRSLDVYGVAERTMVADICTVDIDSTCGGTTLRDTYTDAKANMATIMDVIEKAGLKTDVTVSKIGDVLQNKEIVNNNNAYICKSTISIETKAFDKVADLQNCINALRDDGINVHCEVCYNVSNLQDVRNEVIVESVENARKMADKMATVNGMAIREVRTIHPSEFTIHAENTDCVRTTEANTSHDLEKKSPRKRLRAKTRVKYGVKPAR